MGNVGSFENLPVGCRFSPTDVELINKYLRLKNDGICNNETKWISEVDLCKFEPWDLPDLSAIPTNDNEWFFFCPIDRKHNNAQMLKSSNRATRAGYWKATGKDRTIKSRTTGIGMKKTLVFYEGRASKGQRTNWIIHEYRPIQNDRTNQTQAFVLCRLFKKDNDLKQSENDDCRNNSEITSLVSSPNQNNFPETAVDDGENIEEILDSLFRDDSDITIDDLVSESGTRDPPALNKPDVYENGDLIVKASSTEHGTFNVCNAEAAEFQYDNGITSHCNEPEFGEQHLPFDTLIDDDIFSDEALDRFFNPPVDDMTWLPSFGAALWQVHSNLSSDDEGTVTTERSLSDDFEESGVEDTGHSTNPLVLDKLCRTPLEAEEEVSRESDVGISNQQPARRSISASSKGFRCVLLVFMVAFLFIACIGLRKAQIAFLF